MNIVEEYLANYTPKVDLYQKISKLCAQQCEKGLVSLGIKSIVTYRAKRPGRLRNKLHKRINEGRRYPSIEHIDEDIVDLAGVRIALYFPGNQKEVGQYIESYFTRVRKPKIFPEDSKTNKSRQERKFPGYSAIHYIVSLNKDTLSPSQYRYLNIPIEIQVASVLMHAWSEVNHDLVYKPLQGEVSDDEHAILDELNGLVLSGEIALERLQKAIEIRVGGETRKFINHYELASYLLEATKPIVEKLSVEPQMGRVDLLFRLLQETGLDTPKNVRPLVNALQIIDEKRPIAEQITDEILASNPELYKVFDKIRNEIEAKKPYNLTQEKVEPKNKEDAIGFFLNKWIELEKILGNIARNKYPKEPIYKIMSPSTLMRMRILDNDIIGEVYRIRRIRNLLIHGVETPNIDTLINEGKIIEKWVEKLKETSHSYLLSES